MSAFIFTRHRSAERSAERSAKKNLAAGRFCLALILCAAHVTNAAQDQPNIVFILTDNQPASLIGSYGNPDIRTPNIDALASEGVRFTRAYAVNGMCSPTRATLMTGLMPSQHGVHSWLDDEQLSKWPAGWNAVAEYRSLPLTLKNRGYETAMIGKWHLGKPDQPSLGFEHWLTFADGHTEDFWDNEVIDNGEKYRLTGQHLVDFFTAKAIEYLARRNTGKPFYLQLNYDGPYLNPPTNLGPARNRHYQSYVGASFTSFPRVAFNPDQVAQLTDPNNKNTFIKGKILQSLMMHNDPATMANVASQNTMVDDGVGQILRALDDLGLADSTLIVFSSDQGNFYGQYGLWQHIVVTQPSRPHEVPMNIPLIIRAPDGKGAGKVSELLVGQYDIAPTILDYVGYGDVKFENSPGRSFLFAIDTPDAPTPTNWVNQVYFEQEETRGLRNEHYAYWERLETTGGPVLFDMRQDPEQQTNLAERPDYTRIKNSLQAELTQFFDEYSDPAYDLWGGGVAKGSVDRPEIFRALYGEQWQPTTPIKPAFEE